MAEPLVIYEQVGRVALLKLNDPSTLNAFSTKLAEALVAAVDRAKREAGAIVLTGQGRGFSSGASLSGGIADVEASKRDVGARLEDIFNPLMLRIRDLPMPYVTAVNGAAAGVGCSFALAGDLVVAAQSAYFLQAFAKIGLVPDGGSTYLLAASAGRVRAMEAMLLAEKIPAAQAYEWGLVNRVVPDADVVTVALDLAKRLSEGPTEALGVIRKLAWSALELPFEKQLEAERQAQKQVGTSPDFDEGVAAFREKRAAKFPGRG